MGRVLLALLRHGKHEHPEPLRGAHLGSPLTVEGLREAAQAARAVRTVAEEHQIPVHPVIETSPFLPAWQTAKTMASQWEGPDHQPFEVREVQALNARSLGDAANLSADEVEALLRRDPRYLTPPPGWDSDSFFRLPLPGAESFLEAGRRVAEHLRASARQARQEEVEGVRVLVGHEGSLRHALLVLGALSLQRATSVRLPPCEPLVLELTPADQWVIVGGRFEADAPSHAVAAPAILEDLPLTP